MKINASSVSMASSRSYSETTAVSTSSVLVGARGVSGLFAARAGSFAAGRKSESNATVTLSEQSRRLLQQLDEEKRGQQTAGMGQVNEGVRVQEPEDSIQIKALQRMLEALKRMRESMRDGKWKLDTISSLGKEKREAAQPLKTFSMSSGSFAAAGSSFSIVASGGRVIAGGAVWTRQTVVSSFHSETENTAFSTTGIVKTADGREIGFNVQVEMSRSFLAANEFISEDTVSIMTDPLVINLDTNVASVTDQKFLFDLDADGTMDEISFAGQGSGFLALDKNGDGKVNDGTELFGTQSGNGFADLAAYDEDGNGWIDESDSVFDKLLVWSKDKNGNDRLVGIGKAGVGAIYLGSASTDFSLNNRETNETNGQIRRTGVYLKESGEAGTLQHVDLAL